MVAGATNDSELRAGAISAYGRGVGLLRHRRSNKRSKISRVGRHFPRVPPRESFFFLFSFISSTGEVAAATELDYIDTDYNTIQNTKSDNRRCDCWAALCSKARHWASELATAG